MTVAVDCGKSARMKFQIQKKDLSQGMVFGWANVAADASGALIVDSHGDTIEVAELEQAAYSYVLNSRRGDEMHSRKHVARLVESMVVTKEKREALGMGPGVEGWWVGFKIDDPNVLQKLKEGAYLDFSIGGNARRKG